ncbi:MAG: hypothetical protein HRU19_25150 [Pseudobacteriovorax sp.]|nr:hypothetical protein [Pseudobacteriovorax sp.]
MFDFNRIKRLAIISCFSASILSCGKSEQDTKLKPQLDQDFTSWCRAWDLDSCDNRIEDPSTPEAWNASIGLLTQIMKSPSKINLERRVFDQPSVQTLLARTGGSGILGFVNQIPWILLQSDLDRIILTSRDNGQVSLNGLKLLTASEVVISAQNGNRFGVRGLTIENATGDVAASVSAIDLSQADRLQLITSLGTIRSIPLKFFSLRDFVEPASGISELIPAIADVVTDPNFSWRSSFEVVLLQRDLQQVINLIRPVLPQTLFGQATRQVIQNGKSMFFGGERAGSLVLAASLQSPIDCRSKILDVPILGDIDLEVNFARGIGISSIERTNRGIELDMYGIETNFGELKSIEIRGDRALLKVGSFSIPFQFEGATNSTDVQTLSCNS